MNWDESKVESFQTAWPDGEAALKLCLSKKNSLLPANYVKLGLGSANKSRRQDQLFPSIMPAHLPLKIYLVILNIHFRLLSRQCNFRMRIQVDDNGLQRDKVAGSPMGGQDSNPHGEIKLVAETSIWIANDLIGNKLEKRRQKNLAKANGGSKEQIQYQTCSIGMKYILPRTSSGRLTKVMDACLCYLRPALAQVWEKSCPHCVHSGPGLLSRFATAWCKKPIWLTCVF